ncbi:MAG TPA: hypothetical protein VFE62_08040, partial [Gemmataceae bacterium]|nr:hypothetical protein [Gemmataceae bacterium]
QSFLYRWFAIGKARRDGLLVEFSKNVTATSEEIHGAVFHAAAECPLTKDGDFDDSLVPRIRAIIAEEDEQ